MSPIVKFLLIAGTWLIGLGFVGFLEFILLVIFNGYNKPPFIFFFLVFGVLIAGIVTLVYISKFLLKK